MVKNLPAMQEIQVQSLGQEDPLRERNGNPLQYCAWRIPWTEEPGGPRRKDSDTTERRTPLALHDYCPLARDGAAATARRTEAPQQVSLNTGHSTSRIAVWASQPTADKPPKYWEQWLLTDMGTSTFMATLFTITKKCIMDWTVCPKFIYWSPNLQCNDIWRWGL